MQAILIRGIGELELVEMPKPEPGTGEALIEVAVTGVCRTDLKIVEVGHRDLILPRVPGEEVVGTVCGIGDNVSDDILGQRVYVYPGTSCGACGPCLNGAGNLCVDMQIMGFHRDGGFADYLVAPEKSLIPIPGKLSFEKAVFAEPLSCCLNALEMGRLKADETIAIWGAGPAGTLLARAAQAMGAAPTVMEPDERRRILAGGLNLVPDEAFDVAIVAVGSADVYQQALEHLRPRGRLVVFSGLPGDDVRTVDFNELHYKEQTIVGAYGCSYRHGCQALELLAQGKIETDDMISHRLPLSAVQESLDIVKAKAGMKVLLYPGAFA